MNILDAKRKLLPLSGYMGDSGGGGGGGQPSSTTQTTELPDWARPYAKDVLARGSALTDINQNPYQTYGANRIAGFSPLQQMSFQGAANMQPSQQLGTATDLATAAGVGALGTNYRAGRFSGGTFGQDAADFYMNPYQQNVTDIGKREAARQSNILGTQQAGQATQAGAFGGSRFGVQQAERERNLGQQMADIQAQGSNAAYTNAQQQFNADQARRMQAQQLGEQSRQYGAGLGMQGLQTALQGAGQLGQLGGQQFQQGMDINKLQSAYGGQMQQQAQRPLDQAYQDFLNQQNYPYKQLGFMSDLVRGLPLGQKSTSSLYEAPGSMLGQLGGLGMGAYGLSQMMKAEGGMVHDYADGGVTSSQNVEGILSKLSDEQLAQAKQAALARRDVEQANMIDAELAQRASIRNGLGGAFNQIPEEQQEEMMAGGGIIAFADRGAVVDKTKKTLSPTVESAVSKLAAQTGEPEQDLRAETQKNVEMFKRDYQPLLDQINRSVEEAKPDTEAIKQQGLGQALAQFGFKMAAAAAKPKARFLESASAAAPELASAAAKTQDLMAAQQQNYNKLKMDQSKYEVALQNGNMKDAAILAGQIRSARQADKQLAATMAHYQDQFNIQNQQLDVQRQQVAATAARQPEDLRSIAAVLMKDNKDLSMSQALEKAARLKLGTSADIRADASTNVALQKRIEKIDEIFAPLLAMTKDPAKLAEYEAKRQAAIQRAMADIPSTGYSGETPATPSPGAASKVIRFDAKGQPI